MILIIIVVEQLLLLNIILCLYLKCMFTGVYGCPLVIVMTVLLALFLLVFI